MQVQKIKNGTKDRWIIVDENGVPEVYANSYLKMLDATHSPYTLRAYAYRLLTFCQYLEASGQSVLDVYDEQNKRKGKDLLDDYISFLKDPVSTMLAVNGTAPVPHTNDTINQYKDTVIGFYEYLKEEGYVPETVSFRKKLRDGSDAVAYRTSSHVASDLFRGATRVNVNYGNLPTPEKRIEFVTRSQYIEIFKLLDNERDRLMTALYFEGAMRIGEVCGLHWDDLCDSGRGLIHIVPRENEENGARVKNYHGGTIPIPEYVSEMIYRYERTFPVGLDHDFVFIGERRGNCQPLRKEAAAKKLSIVSDMMGLNFSAHTLRHGWTAEKIQWGFQPHELQAVLRHKSIQTTLDIYAHLQYLFQSKEMAEKLRKSKITYGGVLIPQD